MAEFNPSIDGNEIAENGVPRFNRVGAIHVAVGRVVATSCHILSAKLDRFLPRRVSFVLSAITVGFLVLFIVNGVIARSLLNAADATFAKIDSVIDEGIAQPNDQNSCGSSDSLVQWDSIGRQGKNFIATGSTREDLSEFSGKKVKQPLRVYVGLRSRPTEELRAKLALEELIRVGGFDCSVLVVATPTGTGWLDPSAVDTLEYLHNGDSAIVSMQYSYLPSWLTILVDPNRSRETARILFDEIYGYWTTLPQGQRPRLYVHGLSLGALDSEVSAELMKTFEDPIQGAVWSGPPFPSTQWAGITHARNEGTPAWLPKFRDGRMVRFTNQHNTLEPNKPWGPIRAVYLQYASDPMVFFSTDLLFQKPEWLKEERGPDVSPELSWYPIVTFLQIAFDLPMATSVPVGYGHSYAPNHYIDAWLAVTTPERWSNDDTDRVRRLFAEKAPPGT